MHLGRKEREDLSHTHHLPLFLLQSHFEMQPREQVFLSSSVWIIQVQKPLKLNHVGGKNESIFVRILPNPMYNLSYNSH
jgi:hypothetical protein